MKAKLLFVFLTLTQLSMAQNKKIIFVCQHGAAKSVIAASYFNKLASDRKLNYTAECRGIDPDSAVSSSAKEGLIKDNMFDAQTKPQKLVPGDTANVDMIVLFTPLPADLQTAIKTENWSQVENVDADYSKRRQAIVEKINELLDNLEKQN
jgi:arsenate reductase